MYQTNSFDKLTAAPYVSQYVGNSLAEQARSLERLQGRFDAGLAMENQMTRIVNSIPFDKEEAYLKPQLAEYYDAKIKGYAEEGDYHRNLPKIQNDAAMVESMYKSAQARAEQLKAQRELITKTKASDAVKNLYLSRMRQGESRFTPAGFEFSGISSALPTDYIDVNKELLDRAEEVKKVSVKIGKYVDRETTKKYLASLGLTPDDALVKQVESVQNRDRKLVQEVLMNAMANNPMMQQVISQEAQAAAFNLAPEQVTTALMSISNKAGIPKYSPEIVSQLDERAQKDILAQEIAAERRSSAINMAVNAKSGRLDYSLESTIQNLPKGEGSRKGGFDVDDLSSAVLTGDGGAYAQQSFNSEEFMTEYSKLKASVTLPGNQGGLMGPAREQAVRKLMEYKTLYSNMTQSFVTTKEFEKYLSENTPNYKKGEYTKNTEFTRNLQRLYDAGKKAGIKIFNEIPTVPTGKEINGRPEMVPNWTAAAKMVMYSMNPDWLDTSGGDAKKKVFAEAINNVFGEENSLGSTMDSYFAGGKKEISITPKILRGGVMDKASKYLTENVKANLDDWGIVAGLDGMGNVQFKNETMSEFFANQNPKVRANYDFTNYEIRELEVDPANGRSTFGLVVPPNAKNPNGKPLVFTIASRQGEAMPERIGYYSNFISDLEKQAKSTTSSGEPVFNDPAKETSYARAKLKVVSSAYKDALEIMNLLRTNSMSFDANPSTTALEAPVSFPIAGGTVGGIVKLIQDIDNPATGSYIYSLALKNREGKTLNIITGDSPENTIYRAHTYLTSLPNSTK